jgi:hypothetical protein
MNGVDGVNEVNEVSEIPRPADRARTRTLVYLIVATIAEGLSLVPAAMGVIMSPMAFDSGVSRAAWSFVGIVLAYPVLVLIGLTGAWIAYKRHRHRGAILFTLVPALDLVAFGIFFALTGGSFT